MTHCINSRQMMRRAAPSVVRIGSAGCLTRPHHRHSPGKRVLGAAFPRCARGSGKTTLLRLITLAERPSEGRLTLFGADTAPLDRDVRAALRRRIGIVFQGLWLIDALSAGDNVALPLRIAGAPEHEVRENVAELLAWVGLRGRADARTATLSGGERQRVAIARAIVHRPLLLTAGSSTSAFTWITACCWMPPPPRRNDWNSARGAARASPGDRPIRPHAGRDCRAAGLFRRAGGDRAARA